MVQTQVVLTPVLASCVPDMVGARHGVGHNSVSYFPQDNTHFKMLARFNSDTPHVPREWLPRLEAPPAQRLRHYARALLSELDAAIGRGSGA